MDLISIADGIASVFGLKAESSFKKYQNDPVGYCEQELGVTVTDDIKRMMNSVRDNVVTIAKSCNASGKSLPVETLIPTPTGYRKMGTLIPGDIVFTRNGTHTIITGVYPQGKQATYKIKFNDKSTTYCSYDHLWEVRTSSQKSRGVGWSVLPLSDIIPILHKYVHIPMCNKVQYHPAEQFIDPYVIGTLIADGALTSDARFDSGDQFIIDKMRQLIKGANVKFYRKTHYGITTKPGQPNPILIELKRLGMIGCKSNTKFIHNNYLYGSILQRIQLLKGLMDSDGYICRAHSFSYCTVSEQLKDDFCELIWSLGGTAKVSTKYPTYTYNGEKRTGQKAYVINLKLPFCPFSLPRKLERYVPEKKLQKQAQRIFKSIEKIEDRESVCIKVADSSGLFLINNYIVTHNTHAGAHIADWWYRCFPDSQCYTSASPSANLDLLWAEIDKIIRAREDNESDISKTNEIRTTKSHFIKGITVPTTGTAAEREGKFSGKHAPYLLFILDEGDTLPDYVYRGIESCMSGGILIRLLVLFNPRSKRGIPYRMEADGEGNVVELSAFTHPNVLTGENIIPGAVTRDVTVVRINTWSRPLAIGEVEDEDCYRLPDFLVGCTAELKNGTMSIPLKSGAYKITDAQMFYMVLGKYPTSDSSQLVSEKYIIRAQQRWLEYVAIHGEIPPKYVDCRMGLDVAELGTDVSSVCLRWDRFIARFQGWSKVEIPGTITRATDIFEENNVSICNVDGNGVGAGVGPGMVLKGCRAYNIKSQSKPTTKCELGDFKIVRNQNLWRMREWLMTEEAMLPPNKLLAEEINVLKYGTLDGYVWITKKDEIRELLGRSPDDLDALALTFHPDTRMFSWV